MCGIDAAIGRKAVNELLIEGLEQMENRGYDSAGIVGIKDGEYRLQKYATTTDLKAVKRLRNLKGYFDEIQIGIGHTRWATHGPPTDVNSHPHLDYSGKFALVHNGIIENCDDLKKFLRDQKVTFQSETDSEVIVNLIGYFYERKECQVEDAVGYALELLEGTWGLVIMCLETPDRLICARHGSPLLIGTTEDYVLVASEQSGFAGHVKNYIEMNDHEVLSLCWGAEGFHSETLSKYTPRDISITDFSSTPGEYPHWMLKEIWEQPKSATRAMGMGGRILPDDSGVKLGGLEGHRSQLMEIEHLILVACGTSFYACLHGMQLMKNLRIFSTVQAFNGSEFSEQDLPRGKTAIMLLSQSGETMDLRRCLEIGRTHDLLMLGVINVVDSFLAREVDCGVYLNASKEVSVASTKAYTSQVIALALIGVWFLQQKDPESPKLKQYVRALRQLPSDIRKTLTRVEPLAEKAAADLVKANSCFVLGKGKYMSIAQEGALKLKEIGYIHAEGYSSAALKHGPYSLLTKETPVIVINPEDIFNKKVRSTMQEIKARGALIIEISDVEQNSELVSHHLPIARNPVFNGLLSVLPMQFMAYYMAKHKGHDPDYPRNLAKVVTVES